MVAPVVPLHERPDLTSQALATLARQEQRRFAGLHMRARGRGRRVHAVRLVPWVGDLTLPMPACHQPVASPSLVGDLQPTAAAVTCLRCLGYRSAQQYALPDHDPGQLVLVDLDAERARRR